MALFQKGVSGNKRGRPKGSVGGRTRALMSLDSMLLKKRSQAALVRALEQELKDNPLSFFKTIIMPLLPKESKLALDSAGGVQWRSLLGLPSEPSAPASGPVPGSDTTEGGGE